MTSQRLLLNVAHIEKSSLGNGPGRRFVLWVQGCTTHRCPGCMNPETHHQEPRLLLVPREVLALIQEEPGLEGITLTGGEPFEQARALAEMCRQVRASTDLSVMAYTGYVYEDLLSRGDRWQKQLLSCLDILVDGPFIAYLQAPLMWRGSRNQRVLFLSGRHTPESVGLQDGARRMELIATPGGKLVRTGFPLEWHRLLKALQGHGIEVTHDR